MTPLTVTIQLSSERIRDSWIRALTSIEPFLAGLRGVRRVDWIGYVMF
jgi:hypothetical protein